MNFALHKRLEKNACIYDNRDNVNARRESSLAPPFVAFGLLFGLFGLQKGKGMGHARERACENALQFLQAYH